MAREITFKVGKKSHKLVGSFKAGERISENVADLMMVQREATLAAMMAEKGIPYNARWQMSLGNVVDILEIGCDCIGADVEREAIEAECFAMGFDVAHNKALEYLQLFFAVPEVTPDTNGDKEPERGKVTWLDFTKQAFKAARNWEVQPSEFWAMSVQEWWWEFDSRFEQNKRLKGMTSGGGKFSGPEWDEARKRHKEKMNGKPSPT